MTLFSKTLFELILENPEHKKLKEWENFKKKTQQNAAISILLTSELMPPEIGNSIAPFISLQDAVNISYVDQQTNNVYKFLKNNSNKKYTHKLCIVIKLKAKK